MQCVRGISTYMQMMRDAYGVRFLAFLFLVQFFCKGLLYIIANNAMLPLFKAAGSSAVELQVFTALATSPWAMKPLFGVVCDVVVLGLYHKRYWMTIGTLCSIAGAFSLIVQLHVVSVTVLFFFLIHLGIAVLDLLSEGKYAEYMGKYPHTSSAIVTYVNASQRLGLVVALLFIGPMADSALFQPLFFIALFASMAPFFPVLVGWLPEEPRDPTELQRPSECCGGSNALLIDQRRITNDYRILSVVICVGLLSPVLSGLTVYTSRIVGLVFAVCALIGSVAGGFYAFSPLIAKVALFQILFSVGRINIGSAMDYFYTADEQCLPGGPHFSFKYYITYTGLISACISLLAVGLYQLVFSKWRFRRILLIGVLLGSVASLFDLAIIFRWNLAMGIPDKWFYILGEAIVENVVGTMLWIPTSTIIGKVCPLGLEATVYAFIAGVANLGGTVSQIVGAVTFDLIGLRTVAEEGAPCDWTALPWLSLAGHTIIPLLVGVPAVWLIPNTRQTDHLNEDGSVRLTGEEQSTETVELSEMSTFDDEE